MTKRMNLYSLLVSLVILMIYLAYCYYMKGVAGEELIMHTIKMVLSSWIGKCCGAIFCILFYIGLFG